MAWKKKKQCDTCVRSFLSILCSIALCQRVVRPGRKSVSSQRGVIREDREIQTSDYAGGEWRDRMASEKYYPVKNRQVKKNVAVNTN